MIWCKFGLICVNENVNEIDVVAGCVRPKENQFYVNKMRIEKCSKFAVYKMQTTGNAKRYKKSIAGLQETQLL